MQLDSFDEFIMTQMQEIVDEAPALELVRTATQWPPLPPGDVAVVYSRCPLLLRPFIVHRYPISSTTRRNKRGRSSLTQSPSVRRRLEPQPPRAPSVHSLPESASGTTVLNSPCDCSFGRRLSGCFAPIVRAVVGLTRRLPALQVKFTCRSRRGSSPIRRQPPCSPTRRGYAT